MFSQTVMQSPRVIGRCLVSSNPPSLFIALLAVHGGLSSRTGYVRNQAVAWAATSTSTLASISTSSAFITRAETPTMVEAG